MELEEGEVGKVGVESFLIVCLLQKHADPLERPLIGFLMLHGQIVI